MYICIDKVTKNLDNFQYNVAVASLREFSNFFLSYKFDRNNSDIKKALKQALSNWVIMISPIMPHLAEELWSTMGYKNLVVDECWPKTNKNYIKEENINLVIQVNGKVRDKVNINNDLNDDQIKELTLKRPNILKWTQENEIRKIIIVKGKIMNIVV